MVKNRLTALIWIIKKHGWKGIGMSIFPFYLNMFYPSYNPWTYMSCDPVFLARDEEMPNWLLAWNKCVIRLDLELRGTGTGVHSEAKQEKKKTHWV